MIIFKRSILLFFISQLIVNAQLKTTLETGTEILLNPDGTWIFVEQEKSDSLLLVNFKLEIPKFNWDEQIVEHFAYSLSYNESCEQANWVAYTVSKDKADVKINRKNNFRSDPFVRTGSAALSDYKDSRYDRGHLAPAADMSWSEVAMDESFYLSNMSPQEPNFNRILWRNLEEQVRKWLRIDEQLYIVTGPVLTGKLKKIGKNGVAVPEYYYKVILDYTDPDRKAIGFLMPNKNSKKSLDNFVVSIDSIETLTGIDFFPILPDSTETQLESSIEINKWFR